MFASVGGWLYEDLLGLGQTRQYDADYDPTSPDAVGFRHAVIFPRVTAHPNVTSASGFYDSQAGRYVVEWALQTSTAGNCVDSAPENAPVSFSCPQGIKGVVFASFGTPTGSCGGGFALGSCNAANSTQIVSDACVGKTACTIDVSTATFGDPCFNTLKHFSALLNCSAAHTAPPLSLSVTVPANARATVRVPFPATVPASAVTISEGSVTPTVIWSAAGYVPGVAGITGITPGTTSLPVGQATLDVEVGSGSYVFLMTR